MWHHNPNNLNFLHTNCSHLFCWHLAWQQTKAAGELNWLQSKFIFCKAVITVWIGQQQVTFFKLLKFLNIWFLPLQSFHHYLFRVKCMHECLFGWALAALCFYSTHPVCWVSEIRVIIFTSKLQNMHLEVNYCLVCIKSVTI